MAKLELYAIDPMIKQLQSMGKVDEIAPKMINSAMPFVVESIKKRLERHRDSGALIHSVKANNAKKTRYGGYLAKAQFKGYDPYADKTARFPRGTPNAVKALGLDVGTIHEPARPFLQAAMRDSQTDVLEMMQLIYNLEVGKDADSSGT